MTHDRYIRQRTLPGFGSEAQNLLRESAVLVIGAGGLGVPVLQYLNAMGVGTLGIVDADTVSVTNLHRQPLYREKDVGQPKVEVLKNFLDQQNSETIKKTYPVYLQRDNALEILEAYDVVVDASDNYATRYLVNDACVLLNKPFVYGGLFGFEGQVSVFNYKDGPTYRCLYPHMDDGIIADCNTHGVLGVVPGLVGNLQALEAVKVITGVGDILSGSLLLLDTLSMRVHKMKIPVNLVNKELKELQSSYETPVCGNVTGLDAEELYKNPERYFLLDVRNPDEFKNFHLQGAINIPLNELSERLDEIPTDQPVCLICQQGVRSLKAANLLKEHKGELLDLSGGLDQYLRVAGGGIYQNKNT